MSKAAKLSPQERRDYLDRFDARDGKAYRCEHGHPECAASRSGPCVAEVIEAVSQEDP